MGVPKFYRWLSERYPCLSQVIKDHQIPEFDNLYLDMNGIIHPCSHPNDDDPHFRITEEQIFSNIFHYIEVLFRIIKPQKVFFMAVDGVAPRAKMNQQRSRRFRSAREAEENIRKAVQKGEVLPTEERFDSNCITPGTEFMVRLHEQLKYFVNKKISTDPGWQGIKIYLSGHETPGEGEHKIMDFIRYERSQPGYDPNTRHCLYGLDADLIVLGLTSHDPHFSLLREEIRFGKNVKRVNNPEDITFHLLHLSLLREYIDLEFQFLKDKISYGYDLEKIIDDWILMGFLVGNDFIPNLPNFHINHDALPYLWQVYKDVMPTTDGYLHDVGYLSLPRFEKYLETLSKFDLEKFEDAYVDLKWLAGKLGGSKEEESFGTLFQEDDDEIDEIDSASNKLETITLGSPKKSSKLLDYLQEKGVLEEAEAEDDGDFSKEHEKYKQRYYVEKFELTDSENAKELVDNLCFKYVEAIQWILHYYFNGVPSWGWYYPYHYAPYVSDIKDFQDHPLTFDIGKPFLPFEQLLAVLPAASKKLLPEPFQNLMIMEQSPIIDYYPLEFKTDLNGKRQEWEAVVLIPFIDERRLLDAMGPLHPRLKKGEVQRNRHTPCLLYTYDKEKSDRYPSSLPGAFPDLECCHASSVEIPINKYRLSPEQIKKGLLPNVKLATYFPGFPTLEHIPHSGELRKVGVKVFQMHSRGESMVLTIDECDEPDTKEVAESLLNKPCYVGWPHLVEAFVTSVSDGKKRYSIAKDSPEKILDSSEVSAWKKQASCEKQFYLEKKAVDVGMIHILIEACQIQGKRFICDPKGAVHIEKQWSEWPVTFPWQVSVKDINVCDETDSGAVCATISDLFPIETECFMMAIPHYGSSGKVVEVDAKQNRVRVQLTVVPEPDLVSLISNQDEFADVYLPAYVMAKRLGLSSQALAQITGRVFLTKGDKENSSKVDIGLNLKFSKQDKEVLDYARRCEGNWSFSPKTERVISMYQEKYPQVFEALSSSPYSEGYKIADVFPDAEKSNIVPEIETWLKTLPSHNQTPVKCGSSTLDEPVIKKIEEAVEKLKGEKQNKKNVKVRVKPTVLYRPMKHLGQVAPDPAADFELFDRVVNVRSLGVAPYGLKGTIVGIHQGKSEKEERRYEVLFDEPFMGGQTLRGSFENKLFVVHAWSLLNLTYGDRLERKKKGIFSPHAPQRRPGQPLEGGPADYRPSGKGGKYYPYQSPGAWQSPVQTSSPDQLSGYTAMGSSPRERFATPRERFFTPRDSFTSPRDRFFTAQDRFSSPLGYSPSPQPLRFSPRNNSVRNQTPPCRPRPLINPQTSPHGSNHPQGRRESPGLGKTANSGDSSALSTKESELMLRKLLHMDGQQGVDLYQTFPPAVFSGQAQHSPMPPVPPTSPGSPSVPSGMLDLVCRENGWPPPSFSHHRVPQGGFLTTVCVAGKLFQGHRSANIVESTESAASVALAMCGFLPQSFLMSPAYVNTPGGSFPLFPTSSSPQTPPAHASRSPAIRHQGYAQFNQSKPHEKFTTQSDSEASSKMPPVAGDHEKDSETATSTQSSARIGNESDLGLAGGQRKDIFIPHQVSLKTKFVPTSKAEAIEPSKASSEHVVDETASQPENKGTPKSTKGTTGKGRPKLLAPSFFSANVPKN